MILFAHDITLKVRLNFEVEAIFKVNNIEFFVILLFSLIPYLPIDKINFSWIS